MFEQALLEKFWPKVKQRIILIFYPGLDKKKKMKILFLTSGALNQL